MYKASQLLDGINSYITNLSYLRQPIELYTPIEYTLSLGGKRIRPLFLLLAYNLYRDDIEKAYSAAAGIEMFHNYTLLHDDLMDRSEMRRGKQTVYKIWGDNAAILTGDVMTALAFQYVSNVDDQHLRDVLMTFNTMAIEVCEGQQWDIDLEKRDDVTENDYIEMIRLKTSVLLAASFKIGAIIGGASSSDAQYLYSFGEKVGLAFQLQDDLLDVYGDPKTFGKKIGGDILCNKKTYMLIKAFELADNKQKEILQQWIDANDFDANEKIAAVTDIYNQLDIKQCCVLKINEYYQAALTDLNALSVDSSKTTELKDVIGKLMYRDV